MIEVHGINYAWLQFCTASDLTIFPNIFYVLRIMSKGAFGNIVAKEDNVGDKVFSSLNNGYCPLNDGFSVI